MRAIDLTGQKFGNLTVIKRVDKPSRKEVFYLCKCDCGEERVVSGYSLRKGITKSCGCLRKQKDHMDLTGNVYGRLTVIGFAELQKRKGYSNKVCWNCLCECGNYCVVDTTSLRSGHTSSCGCYKHEREVEANIKHGKFYTRIYKIYSGMLQRCYNPRATKYGSYGDRGIVICDEWRGENGFVAFYDWAMANGYSDELSIDRIDVNGNYEPSNCRWITMYAQASNKTNTRIVEYNGESKNLAQWCKDLGLNYKKTHTRLFQQGWTAERAFSTP